MIQFYKRDGLKEISCFTNNSYITISQHEKNLLGYEIGGNNIEKEKPLGCERGENHIRVMKQSLLQWVILRVKDDSMLLNELYWG